MRFFPEALDSHLAKALLPSYLLYGTESFLIEESVRKIRDCFEKNRAGEYISVTLDNAHTYTEEMLASVLSNRSLFASTRLIHFRCLFSKITTKESTWLTSLFHHLYENIVIIIQMGNITRAQQKNSWFTAAEKKGAVIAHWPPLQKAFAQWVNQRLKEKSLTLSSHALSELLYRTEGNCLAAAQEIEQLALLAEDNPGAFYFSSQNQFSVFDFIQAIQQHLPERVAHILQILKISGTAPILIIWALTQTLKHENSVWIRLAQLDRGIKSGETKDPWPEIIAISLELAGIANFS